MAAISTTAQKSPSANNSPKQNTPTTLVPFVRASAQHREGGNLDKTVALTASAQNLGTSDIPAYGFLRGIMLYVSATGGTGTSVTAKEDGPWNVLQNIMISEPNGAPIVSFNSGYDLYLVNKWFGYDLRDPKQYPEYSAVAAGTGNFSFALWIPLEINERDALGSLPNQNQAATFKLSVGLAPSTVVYGTVPTTLPNVRVTATMFAWDQPAPQVGGLTNETTPPAMNTTQFITTQVYNISAGQQTIPLRRVGNYIRNIGLIYRDGSGTRSGAESQWANPCTLMLDARPLDIMDSVSWLRDMADRSGYGVTPNGGSAPARDTAGGLDNGFRLIDFTHDFDGSLGHEKNDLWLPTETSTRLELVGNFGAAGTLTVLTNDIAVAGSVFI